MNNFSKKMITIPSTYLYQIMCSKKKDFKNCFVLFK
jgi:hypothetical protein